MLDTWIDRGFLAIGPATLVGWSLIIVGLGVGHALDLASVGSALFTAGLVIVGAKLVLTFLLVLLDVGRSIVRFTIAHGPELLQRLNQANLRRWLVQWIIATWAVSAVLALYALIRPDSWARDGFSISAPAFLCAFGLGLLWAILSTRRIPWNVVGVLVFTTVLCHFAFWFAFVWYEDDGVWGVARLFGIVGVGVFLLGFFSDGLPWRRRSVPAHSDG